MLLGDLVDACRGRRHAREHRVSVCAASASRSSAGPRCSAWPRSPTREAPEGGVVARRDRGGRQLRRHAPGRELVPRAGRAAADPRRRGGRDDARRPARRRAACRAAATPRTRSRFDAGDVGGARRRERRRRRWRSCSRGRRRGTCCGRARSCARARRVVVHAAAGGVGTLAVQLAKRFGAGRVIGVASSEEKRELAERLGADATVDSGAEDLTAGAARGERRQARSTSCSRWSAGATFEQSLDVLAPFGRLVHFGQAGREGAPDGRPRPADGARSRGVIGFWLVHMMRRPDLMTEAMEDMFDAGADRRARADRRRRPTRSTRRAAPTRTCALARDGREAGAHDMSGVTQARPEHGLLGRRPAARHAGDDPRGRAARLRLGLDRRGVRLRLPHAAGLVGVAHRAASSSAPRSSRCRRGTPAATAMAAMTIDHLSGGRFILGLGVSGPQVVEGWYGQPFPKPLARTREYIAIMRDIWARRGRSPTTATHYPLPLSRRAPGSASRSSHRSTRCARTSRSTSGAEGPKNVALAPRSCDGWLAMFFSPRQPGRVRGVTSTRGSRARPRGSRRTTSRWPRRCPFIICDDVEQAIDAMRPFYALYFGGMGAKGANFHADVPPAWATRTRSARSRTSTSTARRTRPRPRSRAELIEKIVAGRAEGEDPRRPRGVARVDRHHDADLRRRDTLRTAAELVLE